MSTVYLIILILNINKINQLDKETCDIKLCFIESYLDT